MVKSTTDYRTGNEKLITIHGWKQRTSRRSVRRGAQPWPLGIGEVIHTADGKVEYIPQTGRLSTDGMEMVGRG